MNAPSASSVLARLRTLRYGNRPQPQRDWFLLIVISAILFAGGAAWSYWVFLQANQVEAPAAASDSAAGLNPASIDTVNAVFQKRATERAHYQNDYRFVDPSR